MFEQLAETFNSYTAHVNAAASTGVSDAVEKIRDFISLSDVSFGSGNAPTNPDAEEKLKQEEELKKRKEEEQRAQDLLLLNNTQTNQTLPQTTGQNLAVTVQDQDLTSYTFSDYLSDIAKDALHQTHRTESHDFSSDYTNEEIDYFNDHRDETEELIEKLIEPLEERLFERALALDYISENSSLEDEVTLYETLPLQDEIINEGKLNELGFLLDRFEVKSNTELKKRIEEVYTKIESLLNQSKKNRLNRPISAASEETSFHLAA